MSDERITLLIESVNSDLWLVHRGRFVSLTFMLEIGDVPYLISVHRGVLMAVTRGPFVTPSWTFALRAPAGVWQEFFAPVPKPGRNDLMALVKYRLLRIEGNLQPFMANLLYFKALMVCLRPMGEFN